MRVDEITMMSKIGSNRPAASPVKSAGIVTQILASLLPKEKRPKSIPKDTAHEAH
jgi:hypothetical protein